MTERVEFGVRAPVAGPLASVEAVNYFRGWKCPACA